MKIKFPLPVGNRELVSGRFGGFRLKGHQSLLEKNEGVARAVGEVTEGTVGVSGIDAGLRERARTARFHAHPQTKELPVALGEGFCPETPMGPRS